MPTLTSYISLRVSARLRSCVQPVMLFGGGAGAKPAEGGGGDKKDGGFNMGNMMEGLKKANEIGQKTKDLQKVSERTIIIFRY